MAHWQIKAIYDPDARMWVAIETGVPGLAAEAPTLEELAEKLDYLIPEMVEENAHLIEPARRAGPHEFSLVAHHEIHRRIAA